MNIILSPHLDDAVLSLGGLLSQEGELSLVATFFTGSPTPPVSTHWVRKCGFADSAESMRARKEENVQALRLLGVADVRDYPYLEVEFGTEDRVGEAIERDIEALIAEFPGARLYAPLLFKHPDHEIVARSAAAAARKTGARLFSYQDIPYIFDIPMRAPGRTAIALPFDADIMQKKLGAVARYTSQVPHLGKDILASIERHAAAEALALGADMPYCEVVYSTETGSA